MVGGGPFGWEPGEWTDDTSMAVAIAEIAATGADLRDEQAQDALVRRWYEWSLHATDVGVQTRSVLSRAGRHGISAQTARAESGALHRSSGRTVGNCSLMRTAPVALAYLDDEAALVEAARAVSELTHWDAEACDACVLWCCAIRHAILTGVLDVRIGLQHIPPERRDMWVARLDAAEKAQPSDFKNNGWVVEALQGAWSAITTTPVPQDDPAKVSSESTICAWPSTQRCEAAGTPTQSPPSQAGCSALPMGRRRCLRSGVVRCMAGRVCGAAILLISRPRSPARAYRDDARANTSEWSDHRR